MTAAYTYDGAGLRTGKTVNEIATIQIWDGQNIVLELGSSGEVLNKYIRGINLISTEDASGSNRKYYLFNGHGDVVQLTGTDGTVSKTYEYDAFGNEKNPDENDSNPFRYSGGAYYFDKETGDYYIKARYYDSTIGRFTSEDSNWSNKIKLANEIKIDDPLSLNLYSYCYNNPVFYADPGGDVVVPVFIVIGGYLLQTAFETVPDVGLDVVLEGDDFHLGKSFGVNYAFNLIPIGGEAYTAGKMIRKGDNVIKGTIKTITAHK